MEIYEGIDVICHGIPSVKALNLSRSKYQLFGDFYSHLRRKRRTWLPESRQPPISLLLDQIEDLVERARLVPVPDDVRPVFESMLSLAPALVDHSNNWNRFDSEVRRIRERFVKDGPSPRLFADGEPGRGLFFSRLHSIRKSLRGDTSFEKKMLSLLFLFARSVGARTTWRSGLREWEAGIRGARHFEIDSFSWDYRNCLIEARYQMIGLGLALMDENQAAIFNRTEIKNRALTLYVEAHSRKPEVNWEAYLNNLPPHLFPKKDGL